MKRLLTVCLVLALFGIAAVGFLQITKQQADTEIIEAPSISFGGDTALIIEKEFESIEAMHLAFETDGVPEGGYVLINTGSVEDPDNAKIFVKRADGYKLVTDISGATGAQGEQGPQGLAGTNGIAPLMRISTDTGMWEVSYDVGATWISTGVLAQGPQGVKGEKGDAGAQGPQGVKGDKGDTGATGATGPQGPAGSNYVLTEADKQAIINAVLAQIGSGSGGSGDSGNIGSDTVMYTWDENSETFKRCSSPSTEWRDQYTCDSCGAIVYTPNGNPISCPNDSCFNIDGYFTKSSNPYYDGGTSDIEEVRYFDEYGDGPWLTDFSGFVPCYKYSAECGAVFYVNEFMYSVIENCPHCSGTHDVEDVEYTTEYGD